MQSGKGRALRVATVTSGSRNMNPENLVLIGFLIGWFGGLAFAVLFL